jgi:RecA/RadA recombinase
MAAKIIGTQSKPHRIVTELHSLDRAFTNNDGDIGVVIGIGYEIFGLNHTGKSTFAYSLASIIGKLTPGDIALADFEGYDSNFLSKVATTNGFSGKVYVISEPDDEDQLDGLIESLRKNCCVGILDSIGAIAPMAETKGDIGEANMGRRAFLIAQFARKGLKLFRFSKDKTILMINHWYPRLGGYGFDTPGGEAKKYIASIRIKLQRKETFPDKSYALLGTVVKNRWGFQDQTFNAFMLAGFGLHHGMTALWDCIMYKIIKRTKSGLSLNGENIGTLGHYAVSAKKGETEIFNQFYALLKEYNGKPETEVEDSIDNGNAESGSISETSEDLGD